MNLKKLYKEFENVGDRPGLGGKKFKYIKGAEVIHRLNEVFGGEWSLEIKDVITEKDDILVHVCLTVWSPSEGQPLKVIIKEQFGSASLKRYDSGPRKGEVVDYGNAFKSATTDGIKKAASLLGIGLYLYDLDNPIGLENGTEDESPAVVKPEPIITAEETPVAEPKPTIPPFEESTPPTEEPAVPNLELPVEPADGEENLESSGITDIQKCAIENMSKMKDTTIEEVIKTVVGEEKPLDQLTYTEAATAIKHVNTLKTPKKS